MDSSIAGVSMLMIEPYRSTASTSRTKRLVSDSRKLLTTLKTASLKPPTFRMSWRSGARVFPYGAMSMQTNFGSAMPC
ncbi:hypothetical protein [Roseiconus lacunae]|uniref:hypothetical protein n=1 Tax=Roseiconus lacunae TaxID=2605694 RepID=UPI001E464543|nr:hypothetical protein [Roseiconus lacunae]